MLDSMHVKNLALVDDITIHFHEGLNILTGETGAGKSVLLNSINLCLGEKANKSIISKNKEFALVELTFLLSEEEQKSIYPTLDELGLSIDEDNKNQLYISRKIGDKNICKINGELVNLKTLQTIGSLLLDAHSQHETSKLLNINKHIEILDQICSSKLFDETKLKVQTLYKEWKQIYNDLEKAKEEKIASNKEISFAQYEIEEITNANLKTGEDEELEEQYKLMQNGKNIYNSIQFAIQLLTSSDEMSISDMLGKINKNFSKISDVNIKTNELYSKIEELEELTNDLSSELYSFLDDCNFSEEDMYNIEQRLNLINNLKSKYGKTIEEILKYCDERITYVNKMENYEEYLNDLEKKEQEKKKELDLVLLQLTNLRNKGAKIFEKQIEESLHNLNFNCAKFRVDITNILPTLNGQDKVEFMVILNKGTTEQSLSAVASGGELSRVMLAIKSIIAKNDGVGTLIFDEIDAGISGDTAWLVGNRLFKTAKEKQILCITHLPQIAAFSDYHYIIEKNDVNDKAQTNIYEVDNSGKESELQRLSGVVDKNAITSLLEKANKIKSENI